jgi:BirA family biotin operon repressor/biotin-[acetyl-CoA-carboxylase] ligase
MNYEGLSPSELAARLKTPCCLALPKVTSTLDIIHEMAAEGAPAQTLVLADEQAAGRGRYGRAWQSPKGAGVWLGYLLRPKERPEGGVLALRVGLGLVGALEALGVVAQLKWPNDVVTRDRKICGILCESRWMGQSVSWVAVGIGINVHGPVPPGLADRAVTLEEMRPGSTRLDMLEAVIPRLHAISAKPTLSEDERDDYREHDWLSQRRIVEPVTGESCGIDLDGALLVRTASGIERVVGGSVVAA